MFHPSARPPARPHVDVAVAFQLSTHILTSYVLHNSMFPVRIAWPAIPPTQPIPHTHARPLHCQSGGKSLVAEVLLIRRLLAARQAAAQAARMQAQQRRQRGGPPPPPPPPPARALLVLPYVSIVAEKAEHLAAVLGAPLGARVRGYAGAEAEGGGGAPLSASVSGRRRVSGGREGGCFQPSQAQARATRGRGRCVCEEMCLSLGANKLAELYCAQFSCTLPQPESYRICIQLAHARQHHSGDIARTPAHPLPPPAPPTRPPPRTRCWPS